MPLLCINITCATLEENRHRELYAALHTGDALLAAHLGSRDWTQFHVRFYAS
jgi:hypothetical protein